MRYFAMVLVVSRRTRVSDIRRACLGDSVPYSMASCKPWMIQRASSRVNFDSLLGASVMAKRGSGLPAIYSFTASSWGFVPHFPIPFASMIMRDWSVEMIFSGELLVTMMRS